MKDMREDLTSSPIPIDRNRYSEDLEMWRSARDYYLEWGWDDLADAANKQLARIAQAMAEDFLNGRTESLMGALIVERKEEWRRSS
ncbi:MAG: hypothetical protein AAF546_01375 [Verrucomicrobiota bacterium]